MTVAKATASSRPVVVAAGAAVTTTGFAVTGSGTGEPGGAWACTLGAIAAHTNAQAARAANARGREAQRRRDGKRTHDPCSLTRGAVDRRDPRAKMRGSNGPDERIGQVSWLFGVVGVNPAARPARLPRPVAEWLSASAPELQWRDRAGF